jgi:hypothetical protein
LLTNKRVDRILTTVQSEDLIVIGGLKNTHQRLEMKGVGDHNQLRDRSLEPVDPAQSGRAQHSQAIEGVIPKFVVVGEIVERLQ